MMTRKVYKYPIPVADTFTLDLPVGAEVLTCADQGDDALQPELKLWALVDPTKPTEPRTFRLAGTGHLIADDSQLRYVATVLILNKAIVLHLFEMTTGEMAVS